MNEQWFFARDRKKHGPVTRDTLQSMLTRGEIQPADMVLREGATRWEALGAVLASAPTSPPVTVATASRSRVLLSAATALPRTLYAALAQAGRLLRHLQHQRQSARLTRIAHRTRVDLAQGLARQQIGPPELCAQVRDLNERLGILHEAKGSPDDLLKARNVALLQLAAPWMKSADAPPGLEKEHRRAVQVEQTRLQQLAAHARARTGLYPADRAGRARVWVGSGILSALLVAGLILLVPWGGTVEADGQQIAAGPVPEPPPALLNDRSPPVEVVKQAELPKKADPPALVTPPPGKKSLPELFKLLSPAVPIVETPGAGSGSGFLIQHEGRPLVVTNRHVVQHARYGVEVVFLRSNKPGQEERLKVPVGKVKLVGVHRTVDLALIDVSAAAAQLAAWNIQPVALAPRDHEIATGEHVFAIGHPGDAAGGVLTLTLSDGKVSAVNRRFGFNPGTFTQVDVPLNPGNSGGPIFDDDGKVIAVATFIIRRNKGENLALVGLNFGVNTRHIHELLDDPKQSLTQPEIVAQFSNGGSQPVAKEVLRTQGILQPTDARVTATLAGRVLQLPAKMYEVQLRRGATYFLDLITDDFDPVLLVQSADGRQLAFDYAGARDSQLDFTAPTDGTYKVFAGSSRGSGRFHLTVRAADARKLPPVDNRVYTVGKAGLRLDGSVTAADRRIMVHYGRQNSTLPAKLFQVQLAAGNTYRLHMASAEFDTFLVVQNAAGQQLAVDDDSGGGLNAMLDFTAPATGTYKIFAASYSGTGRFSLTVQPQNGVPPRRGPDPGQQQFAKQALQGTWTLMPAQVGGRRPNLGARVPSLRIAFAGDQVTILPPQGGPQRGTFAVDASSNPKQLMLSISAGGLRETVYAIYEINGNTLRLAFSAQDPGLRRPSGFNDPRAVVWILRR